MALIIVLCTDGDFSVICSTAYPIQTTRQGSLITIHRSVIRLSSQGVTSHHPLYSIHISPPHFLGSSIACTFHSSDCSHLGSDDCLCFSLLVLSSNEELVFGGVGRFIVSFVSVIEVHQFDIQPRAISAAQAHPGYACCFPSSTWQRYSR